MTEWIFKDRIDIPSTEKPRVSEQWSDLTSHLLYPTVDLHSAGRPRSLDELSRSHKDTFFIPCRSRNIFITLHGVTGRAESMERRAAGERGHVEPDRDTGMTLWHVQIPSTELCLAQQHETRKWATNVFPDPPPIPSPTPPATHTHDTHMARGDNSRIL